MKESWRYSKVLDNQLQNLRRPIKALLRGQGSDRMVCWAQASGVEKFFHQILVENEYYITFY